MSKTSILLSVLMTLALVVLFAPGIIAMNRGRILRNIALWLAIFAGLGLIYQTFGPESAHPLFSLPPGVAMRTPQGSGNPAADKISEDKPDGDKDTGNQGFTPPRE